MVPMCACSSAGRCSREEITHMRPTYLRSLVTFALIALLLSGLAVLIGPSSPAWAADGHAAGHVYVLNNNPIELGSGPNSITVFNREADGSLTFLATTS